MQLDALIKLLEAKEIGKKTQASIIGEIGASISRYKRDKNPSRADDQKKPGKCHYCCRAGHGTNENGRISKANREVNCPAFTTTCNKCSLTWHFSAVCRKRAHQKWGKADNLGSTMRRHSGRKCIELAKWVEPARLGTELARLSTELARWSTELARLSRPY